MRRKFAVVFLAVLSIGFSTMASAIPVLWTLDFRSNGLGSQFTLSGQFTYDADTNVFSDIAVAGYDTSPVNLLNTTYTLADPAEANTASEFTLWNSLAANRTNAKRLRFLLGPNVLTNAGGTISLLATQPGFGIFPSRCDSPTCSGTVSYSVAFAGPHPANGSLVGVPLSVPEPATLALLSLGLLGLVTQRRTRC